MSDLPETSQTTSTQLSAGRHAVNIGHLVMGLAFLCFVAVWVVAKARLLTGDDLHWLLPIPWVVAGAGGLVATVLTGVRRRRRVSSTGR